MINERFFIESDLANAPLKPMRDGYGEGLVEAAKRNSKVVALVGDLTESLKLEEFKREYPERFFEMGIAEQNMMGVAAGMALSGKIPFVNSFACFSPGRNWEQLKVSVCLTKNNVKIIGGHSGFGNGFDGANQQSFEDLAITRVLPNLTVIAPADYEQMKKATIAIADFSGPVYMRMTKPARAIITNRITPFEIGKAQVLREGKDITVMACGMMVYEALLAAEELEKEFDVEVINVHTIKPIDKETIIKSAKKTGKVITAEEHSVIGGLGSAVSEVLSENCPTLMSRIGMMDTFGESGDPLDLVKKYKLNKNEIIMRIKELMFRK
jgi:transketolase